MKKDKNMDEILFGKVYYKLRQGVITNCDRYVKIATSFITNCDRYYKLRQPLLQIATGITNCDSTYPDSSTGNEFCHTMDMSTVFQSIKTVLPKLYLQSELKLC